MTKRNKKRKPTCLSKGQPNVNLLTFVSAKHKPTPKHLSCAMYVVLQKSFFVPHDLFCLRWIASVLFWLEQSGVYCDKGAMQRNLPQFPSNTTSIITALQQLEDLKTLAKFASYISLSVFYWQAAFDGRVANGRLSAITNKSHRWREVTEINLSSEYTFKNKLSLCSAVTWGHDTFVTFIRQGRILTFCQQRDWKMFHVQCGYHDGMLGQKPLWGNKICLVCKVRNMSLMLTFIFQVFHSIKYQ